MLAALYAGEEPNFDWAPDEESRQLLTFLINSYKEDVYAKDVQKWTVASREQVMHVELDDVVIQFTLDLLIHDGDYWIVDHKFLSRFPMQGSLDLDDQITGYIWAMRQKGIKVRGLIYNVLLKKSLGPPNLLMKGGVSRSASTLEGTTLSLYREAIEVTGGVEDAYRTELEYLEKREHPIFHRYIETRSAKELQNYEDNLRATLHDMNSSTISWYPNPTYDCYRCEFHEVCKSELEGGDWRSYIGATHRVKEVDER